MALAPVITNKALKLNTEASKDRVIIHCRGGLVAGTCEKFNLTARRLIPTTKTLVLDFSNIDDIDGSGLGVIVELSLACVHRSCELKVINASTSVKQMLMLWPKGAFEAESVGDPPQTTSTAA